MIIASIWVAVSFVASFLYIIYAALYQGLMDNPGEFGDVLAGLTAFVSFPSILIVLYQNARDERRKRHEFSIGVAAQRLQTDMHVLEHLNREFEAYGHDIRYMLDANVTLKNNVVSWDKWQNKDNVFSYLKATYFSKNNESETLEQLKNQQNSAYVCRRFCAHVHLVIGDLEQLNRRLKRDPKLLEDIKTHPVCVIAAKLKALM